MKKDHSHYQSKCSKCSSSALTQARSRTWLVDCLVDDALLQTRPCSIAAIRCCFRSATESRNFL